MKFFSRENAVKKALPFIFVQAVCSALSYLYLKSCLNLYALLTAGLSLLFFAAFDFISRHKKVGSFIYAAIMAAVLVLIDVIMTFARNKTEFIEWFLTGAATVDTNVEYMLTLVLFFTFFISSTVYYFTHITYRISILTLIALIPCAIYVKASQQIPAVYSALLAAADILLYLYHYKTTAVSDVSKHGKAAAVTGYVDFAAAALLIAVLIPKPTETPYYEKFEQFSSYFSFSGNYGRINGSYTEHSGNADLYNQMESRQLFIVNTDSPEYYKVQSMTATTAKTAGGTQKQPSRAECAASTGRMKPRNAAFQSLQTHILNILIRAGSFSPRTSTKKCLIGLQPLKKPFIQPI